jgi:hypothetical protein
MAISAAVWRSTDGRAWELLSADPSFALGESESFGYGLTGALAVEGRVLAFGNSAQFGATVWEGSFPAG